MTVNSGRQAFMMQTVCFNFSQGLDDPLLLGLNKLMNSMLCGFGRRDDFDFTEGDDNSHLRGPLTAPNMVRKR